MVSALRKGMTNGEYVYIISTALSVIGQQLQDVEYWWRGISGKVDKVEAEKAWHSVLTLVPRPFNATKYEKFQQRVLEKAKDFPYHKNETQDQVSLKRCHQIRLEYKLQSVLTDISPSKHK